MTDRLQELLRAESTLQRRVTKQMATIEILQNCCLEAYQVIAILGEGIIDTPDMERALDQLSAAANGKELPHFSILPWPDDESVLDEILYAASGSTRPEGD